MMKSNITTAVLIAMLVPCVGVGRVTTSAVTGTASVFRAKDVEAGFAPKLGTYTYSIYWLTKTGAKATATIARSGDNYTMTTTARTGGFVDLFYRVRFKGEAILDAATLAPRKVEVAEIVRKTSKHAVMRFGNGVVRSRRKRWKKDRPPFSVVDQDVDTKNGQIMDYFSAVLVARGIPWKLGDARTTTVFDGRGLNTVMLECVGRRRLKVKKQRLNTWHIKVKIVQLGTVHKDDDLIAENINLYLTADAAREIVRIEADTSYGDIKVKLDRFEPAGQHP
ncbi:MAG: DUF3108 domain-containing protein [Verrucomicrobia bacterium]|jgi:hypothetical protein|nr:DUF3108 domain-containing protein [Verrucomicrobiota bacterium]